jgi:hypothetical protein
VHALESKSFVKAVAVVVIGLLLALGIGRVVSAPCQEFPKTMRKISIRGVEPKPDPSSFEAQPKVTWRAGNRYARVAEAPDPQAHVHGLLIINEPDVWLINLYDKSVKHIVDTGGSSVVHIPVFPPEEKIAGLKELELGRELSFFTKGHAARSHGEVIKGAATERYKMTVGGVTVILWIDVKYKTPVRIALVRSKQTVTLEYIAYEDLPFDSSLFRPPPGLRIEHSQQR